MRITVGQLRRLFQEGIDEAKIGASAEYLKKEHIREAIQELVASAVASGEIQNEESLKSFIEEIPKVVDMSLSALKLIPFEVWQKIATQK